MNKTQNIIKRGITSRNSILTDYNDIIRAFPSYR